MTVYVLHFDPPYLHAGHYIGYTPDETADRRVREHKECLAAGSPLVKAAVKAGCEVTLAHEFPLAGRDFEAWLKSRRDTSRWCSCCGNAARKTPDPEKIPEVFRNKKRTYPSSDAEAA